MTYRCFFLFVCLILKAAYQPSLINSKTKLEDL